MPRRLIDWISAVVREDHAEPAPHFHQGPDMTPAVCFDDRCANPRLDVPSG
jgi:hypothetical protein